MAGKKLDPQEAFEVLMKGQADVKQPDTPANLEDAYGEAPESDRPLWLRRMLSKMLVVLAVAGIIGIGVFYWYIASDSRPDQETIAGAGQKAPGVIGEERAREIIVQNLGGFLSAETNQDRERFIFPDDAQEAREVFYSLRRVRDVPLWKVLQFEKTMTEQGEIWFVRYMDMQRLQRSVSFQRYGDDYLIHWLAMKAYCEMPWNEFMVKQPAEPKEMRCFLRVYRGPLPMGVMPEEWHVFLLEDRAGLFSELAVMKRRSRGAGELMALSPGEKHPVTLSLRFSSGVDSLPKEKRIIVVDELLHMRWQRLSGDARSLVR